MQVEHAAIYIGFLVPYADDALMIIPLLSLIALLMNCFWTFFLSPAAKTNRKRILPHKKSLQESDVRLMNDCDEKKSSVSNNLSPEINENA